MSFKTQSHGVFDSASFGALPGMLLIGGTIAIMAFLTLPADAQTSSPAAQVSGEFERPYGFSYGQEQQSFDANTRDASGNRVILDGRIMTGMDQSSLSTSSASAGGWSQATGGAGYASGSAVGNQLNVITQGSWNTVIVNSTQINNGDQTTVLNGKLDLQ